MQRLRAAGAGTASEICTRAMADWRMRSASHSMLRREQVSATAPPCRKTRVCASDSTVGGGRLICT